MSKNVINIGIVGLGPRAETLLASIFALPDEVKVGAICDISEKAIAKISGIFQGKNQPVPQAYRNHRELLQNKEIDAVLISTGWNSHLTIARDALAAGK